MEAWAKIRSATEIFNTRSKIVVGFMASLDSIAKTPLNQDCQLFLSEQVITQQETIMKNCSTIYGIPGNDLDSID